MSIAIDPHDEAYQCFLQEAWEHLQTLESGLLNLQQDSGVNQINNLMRAAHSLKGGSSLFGLSGIQFLAHNLENAFKALYRLDTNIDAELEELLLQAYDCLRLPLLDQLETGTCDTSQSLEQAQTIFSQIETKLGHSLEEQLPIPEVELGLGDTSELWLQIVSKEQESLQELLDRADSVDLLEQLTEKVTEWEQIGTSFDFPDLVKIARTTTVAIEENPQAITEIAKTALAEISNILETLSAEEDLLGGLNDLIGEPELKENLEQLLPAEQTVFDRENKEAQVKLSSPNPNASAQALTVRIDLSRLDRIGDLIGDLVTQENGSLLQNQEYKQITGRLSEWLKEFDLLNKDLEENISSKLTLQAVTLVAQIFGKLNQNSQLDREDIAQTLVAKITEGLVEQVNNLLDEKTIKLKEIAQDIATLNQQGKQTQKKRQQAVKQLQNELMQARMLPCNNLLNRFPRMIRDLSAKFDKQVTLKLTGAETLIDKAILEKLYDPLVHIVRNAFDHGIEMPEIRQSKGKNPQGTIEIRCYHRGNYTYIEVQDDGSGLNVEKIRAKIIARNLLSAGEAATLAEDRLYEYIFEPGFSTTEKANELSGRGMGLDAVKLQIAALKGSLSLNSEEGVGTTFVLRLPLTLTASQLLVFSSNRSMFAIPVDELASTVIASATQIELQDSQRFYRWQDKLVPIVPTLRIPSYDSPNRSIFDVSSSNTSKSTSNDITLLLVSSRTKTIAVEIERVVMQEELAVKAFSNAISPPPYLLGCTILGDGRLVPVLDGQALISWWENPQDREKTTVDRDSQAIETYVTEPVQTIPTILLIDDSSTIRTNLSIFLRKQEYQIVEAGDGLEGLEQLRQHPEIKAVFCDVDMPKMNGIEFLVRYSQEFSDRSLPVIMLTSRDTSHYFQLAKRLGATAYLTKPYLELELLKTLQDSLVSKK
jgi:chemotaxis family two-component system sensor histidine kinase/response regulator PixL